MFTIIAAVAVALVVGFGFGILGTKAAAQKEADIKVTTLHDIMQKIMLNDANAIAALAKALNAQEEVIKAQRREKRKLANQLSESTEQIALLEDTLNENGPDEGDDNEDPDEDSDISDNNKSVAVSANKAINQVIYLPAKVKAAVNTLEAVKAILVDASSKQEQIHPDTLLGIVNRVIK